MTTDYDKCPQCNCPMPEPKEGTAFGGWHTEAEIGGWTCTVNQLAAMTAQRDRCADTLDRIDDLLADNRKADDEPLDVALRNVLADTDADFDRVCVEAERLRRQLAQARVSYDALYTQMLEANAEIEWIEWLRELAAANAIDRVKRAREAAEAAKGKQNA